jgi:hypothetical protein
MKSYALFLSHNHLSGFGEHPHRDAEICTYVVDGFLSHEDSMGTKETLQRGDIQFMVSDSPLSLAHLCAADCWARCVPSRAQSSPNPSVAFHSNLDDPSLERSYPKLWVWPRQL